LNLIVQEYNQKYQTNLDKDIKDNFSEEVARLVLKMIHKNSKDYD
jgi:hypothetical protein